MAVPLVSVIIPVFNDSKRLELCLQALVQQTYPSTSLEVIVIDNASEENIKAVTNQFDFVKLTFEPAPGSYAARNRGIAIAQGEVIAFTDSDCIPAADWLEAGVNCLLSEPNCGLVAGRIDLFWQNPERPTAVEIFEKIELNFFQEEKLKQEQFGMTANLFTFKRVLEAVGNFDSSLKSGGDRDWGQRVYAAGYQQLYADTARVAHPARQSFHQLSKRIRRLVGGSFDQMMSQQPTTRELLVDLLRTFNPPVRSLVRAWRNQKLEGFTQKLQFIRVMFFARYIVISEKLRLYWGASSHRG